METRSTSTEVSEPTENLFDIVGDVSVQELEFFEADEDGVFGYAKSPNGDIAKLFSAGGSQAVRVDESEARLSDRESIETDALTIAE